MSKRQDYIEKFEGRLREIDAEISKFEAKAQQAGADAKLRGRDELAKLLARKEEMANHLERLRNSSDEAWDDVKAGLEGAWNSLQSAFTSAASRYRDSGPGADS